MDHAVGMHSHEEAGHKTKWSAGVTSFLHRLSTTTFARESRAALSRAQGQCPETATLKRTTLVRKLIAAKRLYMLNQSCSLRSTARRDLSDLVDFVDFGGSLAGGGVVTAWTARLANDRQPISS